MFHRTAGSRFLSAVIGSALGTIASMPCAVAATPPTNEVSAGLEEIVVTARRRREDVQSTPVSMVALSGDAIRVRSISNFKELSNFIPNFEMNGGIPNGGGSAAQLYIRGVGQDDYAFPNEPGVGLYRDGVYIARSAGGDFSLLDLERIEVLRGPQGTLYGRNTIGGAVAVYTRMPDGSFSGDVMMATGSYNRLEVNGVLFFPILGEELSGKIAVGGRERDGLGENFYGDDLGSQSQRTVRGALRYKPNDSVQVYWLADWMRQRQPGPAGSMVYFQANGATDGLINPVLAPVVAADLGLQPPYDTYGPAYVKNVDDCNHCVYSNGGNRETRDWAEIWGTSLTVDWALTSDVNFKSITAYRNNDIDVARVSDGTPFNIVYVSNPETTEQITQEFQVVGNSFGGKLDWVTGLYGFKEEGDSTLYAPLIDGTYALIGLDLTALIHTKYDGSSVAAYGEGTWHFTDRFGMTLGGRFTQDKKEYTYDMTRPQSGVVLLPKTKQEDSWDEFLPKLGAEFQQTPDVLWFANISRGYKSGGYNARDLSGNPPQPYDPEYINAYEVGVKTSWLGNRLIANAAVFYNDYEDIQLLTVTDLGGGNVQTNIANAAKARIIGGEFELTALPLPELELSLGIGTLDTEYQEVGEDAIVAGISPDAELGNAPKLSLNAGGTYTVPLQAAGSLAFRLDATYRSSQYRDAKNSAPLKAEAYTIVNARVSWMDTSDRWEVALYGTNLTDDLYITNGVEVLGLGYMEAYYNRPREWGLDVGYKF